MKNMDKYYKIISVGGDPDDAAMLSQKLATSFLSGESSQTF